MSEREAPELGIHETERGFLRADEVGDESKVRVYESSGIEPHVWLRVTGVEERTATAYLPIEDAQRLSEQLAHLVRNHFLLVSHPMPEVPSTGEPEDVPQDGVCYWSGCDEPPTYGAFFCEEHGDE